MFADYTKKQLDRLYLNVWRRMTEGDGYQEFGYDMRTLRITKPGFANILTNLHAEFRRRQPA